MHFHFAIQFGELSQVSGECACVGGTHTLKDGYKGRRMTLSFG